MNDLKPASHYFSFVYISLCCVVPCLRASETALVWKEGPWVGAVTRAPLLKRWKVNLETGEVVSKGAIREARFYGAKP